MDELTLKKMREKKKKALEKKKKEQDFYGNDPDSWFKKKIKAIDLDPYILRKKKKKGGGVGIQTHGNKLAKPLNTQTPDHSVYLNKDNYLKGGIKVRK